MLMGMRARRSIVAAIAFLLNGATPVLAVMDAAVESQTLSTRVDGHIEQQSGEECERVHPAHCGICQQAATARIPEHSSKSIASNAGFVPTWASYSFETNGRWHSTPPSRAPPVT